jgi:hypothetical protein
VGYTIVAQLNIAQTLLVDLLPGRGSAVTGANNFVRCSLGAAMVSVIDLIIQAVGEGMSEPFNKVLRLIILIQVGHM